MSVELGCHKMDSINLETFVENLPNKITSAAAEGFIFTTAISLFLEDVPTIALRCGAMAAIVTLVEAVTRPIIRSILPDDPRIARVIQGILPVIITMTVAASVVPWMQMSYQLSVIVALARHFFTESGYGFYASNNAISYLIF